ncbi:MFS transporter [Streptomyces sp. NPDC006544]|uniref:MFS transporter n=1 Tax=Streptomyces sp. NPDC006544 TaxID=3154583 RepID=UPI0033BF41EA
MRDIASRMRRTRPRDPIFRQRNFRLFFLGYVTSLLGSAMAPVSLIFAILAAGGSGSQLGGVMAAQIVPMVLCLLWSGVLADRFGSRRVMLMADALRCVAQLALALVVWHGHPPLWALIALSAIRGVGEGFFTPALTALIPRLTTDALLPTANASIGVARSVVTMAGPACAGALVATVGSTVVLFIDAATYGVSVLALSLLRLEQRPAKNAQSMLVDLREGWSHFRSCTWLWVTTVQFTLFNLVVASPFFVLGPVVADRSLGGAASWGLLMGLYGLGSVLGGLSLLGRVPGRPLLVATLVGCGWALPNAALGSGLSTAWVAAAVLAAGMGSAISTALSTTSIQRHVPAAVQARVSSYGAFGAFALGPLGLVAAGPLADRIGTGPVLLASAVVHVAVSVGVLAVPVVRHLPAGPSPAAEVAEPSKFFSEAETR